MCTSEWIASLHHVTSVWNYIIHLYVSWGDIFVVYNSESRAEIVCILLSRVINQLRSTITLVYPPFHVWMKIMRSEQSCVSRVRHVQDMNILLRLAYHKWFRVILTDDSPSINSSSIAAHYLQITHQNMYSVVSHNGFYWFSKSLSRP